MLKSLHLKNVGPAPEMQMELAPRLNLITGDNGLGKSFLIDVAWWALTRKWPQDLNTNLTSGYGARPTEITKKSTIEFEVESKTGRVKYESTYVPDEQSWLGKAGRPWNPGLVVYALADGGFAVWDPARNYWKKKGNVDIQDRVPAYVFSSKDVWDGLRIPIDEKPTQVSNGLVADWASWIRERGEDARRMAAVLEVLAPTGGDDSLKPGESFARLSINDARDIPTIRMGYGQEVPILYASLGVRRITALAYMLSWAWREHLIASKQLGQEPSSRIVLLFDEIEAHLHPRWQRAVVPALLKVMQKLTNDEDARVQLIAATHSPLVLASVEPLFDRGQDAWFDLDFENQEVILRKRPFVRRGEVGNWLTSEAFDLGEPRSIEAEVAMREALNLCRQATPEDTDIERVNTLLQSALGDTDRFWVRWTAFRESLKAPKGKKK
ncbi:AAA family ATPase [Pseudomonas sp. NFACC08-1]|uniref:AAA family ATPase n=1 Tax=Pseudomonas sp. NFACC08-1 TaxID=1566238 RepID=UPI00089C7CF3|nr:ATP-binding protein [Pseudomonas sp. NFACC08-1]SDY00880.1 AAA domain-containing protein, putative AbiEii toxin, Type IV TA system [Pseudomonas sp. NFACC08-1]